VLTTRPGGALTGLMSIVSRDHELPVRSKLLCFQFSVFFNYETQSTQLTLTGGHNSM
jgi:hypothetical protein